ncbi:MAG: monosaccharide transporter substrate-binding protein family [Verrucomicrobiales bacterium]|nr:monosaccharide transporter substrate-binding protein family [Verrucomicrobiales bacterium]
MRTVYRIASYLLLAAALAGCNKKEQSPSAGGVRRPSDKVKIAYVSNGVDPFWNVAAAGTRAAAKEFNAEVEVLMPPKGIVDQKRMIETALARGVDGIAISPIDAKNQVDLINTAADQAKVITDDSDAPDSKRLCFVGMNNYKAGREAGKLVKEALPSGGKVMIFVGRLEQLNAQQRRQGVIDELMDRAEQALDAMKYDAPGEELKGPAFTIISTRTDNFDYPKAKANAEDAITAYPDLGCMVGLFAYNAPNCLEAVKQANKVGSIKIVSFDEQKETLQGITDGSVYGTVSQQPYQYGYHSVRILAGLVRGDETVLPPNKFLEVPIKIVKKNNVDTFWAELKKLQAGS